MRELNFERSLKPKNAIEDQESPYLILFSDGSKDAYGTAAYVRWKTEDGYVSTLLAAKSRIAPLRIIDTVRLELCGAVLNARLYMFIRQEMSDLNFHKVYHIVDSEIVKAMVNKESYGFSTFAANRIGEIHQSTDKENWYWVESRLNVADLTTRDCSSTLLGQNSVWQKGPDFLKLHEAQWPIQSETSVTRLPEIRKKFVGSVEKVKKSSSIASVIDINRFSKLNRLLYTTARLEKLYTRFRAEVQDYDARIRSEDLLHAEETWIKFVQESIQHNLTTSKYKKLLPVMENGVIMVGGRTEGWVKNTWNRQKFVLLPKESRLSYLIAEAEHVKVGHLASESTIAVIRAKYWIVGVRRIVNSVIQNCRTCKEKFKKLASQKMAPLPIERMIPSPPFTNIGLDYFGPFEIKGEVQKRTRGKCYGVIFVCDSARAIHVEAAQNYST